MDNIIEIMGTQAVQAKQELLTLSTTAKNEILRQVAKSLKEKAAEIIAVNTKDVEAATAKGLTPALIDRLTLTPSRITAMAQSLEEIANFPDPIGEIVSGWRHENGLTIAQKRVPIGVIGMIYESRPNVTIDVAALSLKTSNAVILRGSSSTLASNKYLNDLFNTVGKKYGLPNYAVQLIESPERTLVQDLIQATTYIDVIIPRGGKKLKEFIIANAMVPVIETGAGVCHVYVDASGNIEQAIEIIINAKTQRPSVCNSIESVLAHQEIAPKLLPKLTERLLAANVELRYDIGAKKIVENQPAIKLATSDDFGEEYLDLILSLKLVADVNEAIEHINTYSTHHSDAIISQNAEAIEKFLNLVDSAVVYANASTRFSDGGEFGFGGEIGISTQKLHARGPMGLKALTTIKYIVRGEGQIR
jgi:gamma-glutamyl phosphate reductase